MAQQTDPRKSPQQMLGYDMMRLRKAPIALFYARGMLCGNLGTYRKLRAAVSAGLVQVGFSLVIVGAIF